MLSVIHVVQDTTATDQNILPLENEVSGAVPPWINGRSIFDKADITEVLTELQRQYDVQIIGTEKLKDISLYTGGFPHDDLASALKIVFDGVGISYRIDGKEVRIVD